MGDYDFLSGLDLGDLGAGVAGAGANMPDLSGINAGFQIPDVSGMSFDLPNMPSYSGVMNGINLLAGTAMMPDFTQQMPQAPQTGTLPAGAGVTLNPQGEAGLPPAPWYSGLLKPTQTGLQAATGVAGLGLQGLGIKNAFDMTANARDQAKIQRGFQQNQQQLQQQQQKSVAPLQKFGTNQLQQAAAGQVDPAIQAYIDQWAQGQKVKMAQQFAKMGLTNSPMYQSALGQIDQQALTMRSSVIGQDKQQAIAALQAAMGGTVGAMGGANAGAQVANQEQNQLDNLIKSSQAALAQLNAMAS